MPKEEWGTKRLCPHCATRFYDLNRDPMTCPSCSNVFTAESLISGRSRALISEKTAAPNDDDVIDDEDLDSDTDTGDLDDDLLDEDEDDGDVSLDDIADVAGDDED